MKLGIAKNTWITEAELDFAREGYFSGALMVTLTFSGGSCPGDEFMAELIQKLSKASLPKERRIVRLQGLYDPKDQSLLLLVMTLKSWGFIVQATITDSFTASWLMSVDWVILRLTKQVALIAANEIWYFPTDGSELVEPQIPEKAKLLYIAKGRSVSETIRFVADANNLWSLL